MHWEAQGRLAAARKRASETRSRDGWRAFMNQACRSFLVSAALLTMGVTVAAAAEITPGASGVTASTQDTNVPGNTVDNNLGTRWSGNGDGAWIRFDLGSVQTVAYVRIA